MYLKELTWTNKLGIQIFFLKLEKRHSCFSALVKAGAYYPPDPHCFKDVRCVGLMCQMHLIELLLHDFCWSAQFWKYKCWGMYGVLIYINSSLKHLAWCLVVLWLKFLFSNHYSKEEKEKTNLPSTQLCSFS